MACTSDFRTSSPNAHRQTAVPGLWIWRNAVGAERLSALLHECEGMLEGGASQAQRFGQLEGEVGGFAEALGRAVQALADGEGFSQPAAQGKPVKRRKPTPRQQWSRCLFNWAHREPAWDQCIVNRYAVGGGITPHVDLPRFQDGIAGITLVGHCRFRLIHVSRLPADKAPAVATASGRSVSGLLRSAQLLSPTPSTSVSEPDGHSAVEVDSACVQGAALPTSSSGGGSGAGAWQEVHPGEACVPGELEVQLAAGDVLLMCGPARFEYCHAIPGTEVSTSTAGGGGGDTPPGVGRVSLTLRRLAPEHCAAERPASPSARVPHYISCWAEEQGGTKRAKALAGSDDATPPRHS